MMRQIGAFILVAAVFSARADAGESQPGPSCERQLEAIRRNLLENLRQLEEALIRKDWQSWKAREVIYGPMWQARVKMIDGFSDARKAEGQVLLGRYQHLAEVYTEEAGAASREAVNAWKTMRRAMDFGTEICDTSGYRDCFQQTRDAISGRLTNLKKTLQEYSKTQASLTRAIQKTSTEIPSDHVRFAVRFLPEIQEQNILFYPVILGQLRELREILEWQWPAERCCGVCAVQKKSTAEDPVLLRLKPSGEGSRALEGREPNRASLLKAFDRLKKDEGVQKDSDAGEKEIQERS